MMGEGARSRRHCPWRHAAAGPRRKLLAAAPVSRAQTPSSSIASWVCALGQGRRRATPAPPGSLCDLSLCARADGRRRTKASRARGGTLPQTKSFIRPQCAREVDGGRTRRPGLLERLVPQAIPSLQCTSKIENGAPSKRPTRRACSMSAINPTQSGQLSNVIGAVPLLLGEHRSEGKVPSWLGSNEVAPRASAPG